MTDLARACALVLAALFGWAAVAKMAAHRATVAAFAGLGLPAPGLLAVAVPAVELAVAAGLAWWPAGAGWIAVALLAAFTAVIVRAKAAGVSTGCACFGAPSTSEPVSAADLVRNGALAAAAVLATGAGRTGWPGLPALVTVVAVFAAAAGGLRLLHRRLAA